jgi:parallel beta-helix repeat protein
MPANKGTIKGILAASVISFFAMASYAQQKAIKKGMRISSSVKIKKAVYNISASESEAIIVIEGNNIIVDFNSAELRGTSFPEQPDEFTGTGIVIRNGKNITIKNLKVRGFKIALLANNVEKLTLDNCDLSYNYRQHLNSTQEKEDISDWMSYHKNEKDEWKRYGAGIYLRNCNFSVIRDCKVTGGQNALMMTECNDGMIYNNDFSFNSGIGIGMYRCSRNNVLYNRVIFNVRGYSHGVYNRGQDSAGLLVYEQSNNNRFYKNNVTHGGDGFFLWAGQTTMDSGKGGCNDNVISDNDFSYAPTNGIEATFSRNAISGNRIFECDHGIWGGYSYGSSIISNKFRDNRIGIAIEHGQNNKITYNLFYKDGEAIRLWARNEQPSDWGYAKYRDTRSTGYTIVSNSFNSNPTVFNFNHTSHLNIFNNTFSGSDQVFNIDSTVSDMDTTINDDIAFELSMDSTLYVPDVPNPADPFKGTGYLAGRKNIMITEWGPYDFRSPVIWNNNPTDTGGVMQFDLLGPKGSWKIKSFKGVDSISALSGGFPASITAKKIMAERTDIFIELEYTGPAITTSFGQNIPAGKPYTFSFRKFFQPIDWHVSWFSLDTTNYNPVRTGELFQANTKFRPFKSETINKLNYAWWGGIKDEEGIQHTQFITFAEGKANFLNGEYELSVTWDDAARVYIDDKMVLDEWNPSLYKFDESPNRKINIHLDGNHQFRVEHMELGGFATLNVKLNKLP